MVPHKDCRGTSTKHGNEHGWIVKHSALSIQPDALASTFRDVIPNRFSGEESAIPKQNCGFLVPKGPRNDNSRAEC